MRILHNVRQSAANTADPAFQKISKLVFLELNSFTNNMVLTTPRSSMKKKAAGPEPGLQLKLQRPGTGLSLSLGLGTPASVFCSGFPSVTWRKKHTVV